jgi:hypothetical protein
MPLICKAIAQLCAFHSPFSLSMSDMGIYDNYPLVQLSNRHQAGEIVSEVPLFLLKQDSLGSTR